MAKKIRNIESKKQVSVRKKGVAPNPIKMKYFEVEMGSFGDTFEERISKISEIGKEATKDFQVKYKKIQDWFSKYDQLSVAVLASSRQSAFGDCMSCVAIDSYWLDSSLYLGIYSAEPHVCR